MGAKEREMQSTPHITGLHNKSIHHKSVRIHDVPTPPHNGKPEQLLSDEQEVLLSKQIKMGTQAQAKLSSKDYEDVDKDRLSALVHEMEHARKLLHDYNTGMIITLAKQYASFYSSSHDLDDLIQEGRIGLDIAIFKYDHTRDNRFSTYAYWWVRSSILTFAYMNHDVLSVSHGIMEDYVLLQKIRELLQRKLGREPTDFELESESNIPMKKIKLIKRISQTSQSLDRPIYESEPKLLIDTLHAESDEFEDLFDRLDAEYYEPIVQDALDELSEDYAEVLKRYYGLYGVPLTLRELAEDLSLSYARIQQIRKAALEELKYLIIQKLDEFHEVG